MFLLKSLKILLIKYVNVNMIMYTHNLISFTSDEIDFSLIGL